MILENCIVCGQKMMSSHSKGSICNHAIDHYSYNFIHGDKEYFYLILNNCDYYWNITDKTFQIKRHTEQKLVRMQISYFEPNYNKLINKIKTCLVML